MKKATVYTKNDCPFCDTAISLLESNDVDVTTLKMPRDLDKPAFESIIFEVAGVKPTTVPQIILDDKYIGGCDDLIAFYERQSISDIDFSDIDL